MAYKNLCEKGIETFLPLYLARRSWSDRKKNVEVPLFPGYLFCRFDMHDRIHVLTTPGVVKILSAGGKGIEVQEEEISTVKSILISGLNPLPWPFLNKGSNILIERGPLAGVEGIYVQDEGADRLVVSVSLLQRSVAVTIDSSWIRPTLLPLDTQTGTRAYAYARNSYSGSDTGRE